MLLAKKKSNVGSRRASAVILVIMGILIMIISIRDIYNTMTYDERYDSTIATITDVHKSRRNRKTRYRVYVSYKYEGRSYYDKEVSGVGHKLGDKVTVYISPMNPNVPKVKKPLATGIVFTVAGVAFIVFGVVTFKKAPGNKRERPADGGFSVSANVTQCSAVGINENGQMTYIIQAEYVDLNGIRRQVQSQELDFDPTPYINANGGKINVYIYDTNTSRYRIDIDSMRNFAASGAYNNTLNQ